MGNGIIHCHQELEGDKAIFHSLWDNEKKEMIGSAMVTVDQNNRAILWIISVQETMRHKGYGSALLAQIQQCYDIVETQWLNPIGKMLCLKCGFDYQEPNGKDLYWMKTPEPTIENVKTDQP